jgi:tetratricopeptide (TPR) repeat protein
MRRIVFIGNCQLLSLSQLYRRFADRAGDEQITYLPSYEDLTQDRITTITDADVIVEQRMDVAPKAEIGGIATTAERHFVPLLAGGFLWPFAGQPHPRNESHWFLPSGPFDGEMSDSYLNRLIEQGVPSEEAVKQYLALDVNRVRNLDRFFEIIVDRQRSRDEACGFQIADLIVEHFRNEPLYRTPHHPNLRVALSFATQFFRIMRVDAASTRRLHEQIRITPYPKTQLPIHPAVAQHFNLKYADNRTRYRIQEEGRLNFAEYALRYMKGEWNRDLAEGIALAGRDLAQALPKLEAGLERSPNSAEGWYTYADALRRAGRPAEAETAGRRAIPIDPTEGRYFYGLGHTLLELDKLDEAAEAAERAVLLEPFDQHFYGLAANIALRRGRLMDAESSVRQAIELDPANPHTRSLLGDTLLRQDRPADAAAAFRAAIELGPDVPGFHIALSRSLARLDRMPEAIDVARRAAALDPDNAGVQGHLSHLLAQSGDVQDAEANLRASLAANPDDSGLHEHYGHLLARLGRPIEAEAAFRRAVDLAPGSAGPLAGLSHTLARIGRHHEAVAAIEAAIEIQPRFAPFHVHLGNQLWIVEQFEGAESAYQAALAVDPNNRDAERQLRGLRSAVEALG